MQGFIPFCSYPNAILRQRDPLEYFAGSFQMEKVFIYWDNSNIFISAQQAAINIEGEHSRFRVRLHFKNLLDLARGGREIEHAVAVGSVPPELKHVWNQLENEGFEVQLLERGALQGGEQGVDQVLQSAMLRDALDYNGNPGIVVLLTGDGSGFSQGVGFHADLERMRKRGWRIEVLSWRHSCNRRMREWAEEHGKFIALDDFYYNITFLEPSPPGRPVMEPRIALDLEA